MSIDYLISKNSSFELIDSSINASYSLSDKIDHLKGLFSIFSIEDPSALPAGYRSMFSTLGISDNFCHFIPRYVFRSHVSKVKSIIESIVENPKNKKYIYEYLKIRKFLDKLNSPTVDRDAVLKLSLEQKHDGPKETILKFLNTTDCKLAPKTHYNNSSTSTGRLTVVSGPNILTAPSKIRNCFKSEFKNGKIVQIDIVAAEPKFALYIKDSSQNIPPDVYKDISEKVFSNKLSRAQIKIATLCALYGQSSSKLASLLPSGTSAVQVISDIKEYFGVKKLRSKLRSEFISKDVRNYLGRPLSPADEGLLISHFLQSSVAEAAILMFEKFCSDNPDVKPHYIIHDALLVDAPESFFLKLKNGSSIDLFFNGWKFESKVTFLSNS